MKDLGPDHWESLYLEGRVPWDAGGVPVEFEDYLARKPGAGRALVPGCGSGYEVVSLARSGFEVVAVDFSATAIEFARNVTRGSGAELSLADFFSMNDDCFELVYERAFMCALLPSQRSEWSQKVARLVRPGGVLVGYFFLDGDELDGPPFGIWPDDLQSLLGDEFELVENQRSRDAKPVFGKQEYWQVWTRRT
ncbi:MAG: methyltransferase domain-containing protein [Gammaproteobacteria bacterium]